MTQTMDADAPVLEKVREVIDHAKADQVFGAPISENGVTILPAAKMRGGGGGGGGTGPEDQGKGSGGGVGVSAKALGVFVVREGQVSWRPAVDVTKIVLGGQVVLITALLVARALIGSRRQR
ncbi:putative spore protein YtfJ [Hamadaea flava]|uniref:Spore germination protein GerW family protein n=1 Tax=Hamadaea flava TaxID=1742688 RepID=A0ABV8LW54_9ACTN|nr:spore germination protein GerW family protein [Hamadaea flava]MCP2327516.1 putative spore protein YtfJ [Hamadaea flava]